MDILKVLRIVEYEGIFIKIMFSYYSAAFPKVQMFTNQARPAGFEPEDAINIAICR